MRNFDLHCHSNVSDGVLAPASLAARAKARGVDVWALTDHDEVGGIAEARAAAASLGLPFVPGVEISITWAGQTVHIVGLHVDERNPVLRAGLARTRSGRELRAREMAEQLAAAGIPDAYEGALSYAGNPDLISRTHFARYIIDRGICRDVPSVFRNYLIEGKPGYVPHRWATLQQSVEWIKAAGGTAIEVITGSHTPDQYEEYARVAQRYGFLASRGSDFHGPGESRVDLGALPPLPSGVKPVWHDWVI
jgi:predicted metal-dependent phosphoesterase TrpH